METLPTPLPSQAPETPSSSTHQPKSEPLDTPQQPQIVPAFPVKTKCVKCGSLDALPLRALFRLAEGAEDGRRQMLKMIVKGTSLRDTPLCSGCFMHAKGCYAFRMRLHMMRFLMWSTRMNGDAIQAEERAGCFETELVRHLTRLKDADELIDYVHGMEKPYVGTLRAPASPDFGQEVRDHMPDFDLTAHERFTGSEADLFFDSHTYEENRERLVRERGPRPSSRPPPKDYPVQLTDLLALKEASENYMWALGRTADGSQQRRRITQLLNRLLDDFMRLPPILHSQGLAATNAAVSNPTPVYCRICEWCRHCLALLASHGLASS